MPDRRGHSDGDTQRRRQDDADNGEDNGVGRRDDEGVPEGVRRFVGKKMLADGRLVFTVQEPEPVGDVPFLDRAADVGEEPGNQRYDQNARNDLQDPLDDAGMPPDRECPYRSGIAGVRP